MLNELYEVSTALTSAGVKTASWHRHFKPNPKPGRQSPAYIVQIDSDGKIADVQTVFDRDRVGSIRKWEVENGVSFPSFNVVPLYKVAGRKEEREEILKFRKELLSATPPDPAVRQEKFKDLVNRGEKLWTGNKLDRISKCLQALPKQVAGLLGAPPDDYKAIAVLIQRVSQLDAEKLFEKLAVFLRAALLEKPGSAKDFFDLLFFCPKDNKTKMKSMNLILELADQSAFSYPANHERLQRWMNEQFLVPQGSDSGERSKDAYGKSLAGWEETFPACRLSVLGNVILRAMSSESPCQQRYGSVDARSYPVGSEARKAMKAGLEWLAGSERKGRTWCEVSGGNRGKPTILFAYPSALREDPPHIAGLFANSGDGKDPDGSKFAACAERLTVALQGIANEETETDIRVFVLEKADKARTKVICHCRYHARRLIQAAQEWQSVSQNAPEIRVRRFGATTDSSPVWEKPLIPFPIEVVWCLNTVWACQGTRAEEARRFPVEDGLNLLLDSGPRQQALAGLALETLSRNAVSLLLAMGQAHHQSIVHCLSNKFRKYEKQVLLIPSILGLLLGKAGSMKGVFMHQPHFLVGRLLSLADRLHEQYCQKVRKGSVPPQLVGNALMAAALEQPTQALAMLSQRILPYQAWAKSSQGEESRLAKFFLAEMGRLCHDLVAQPLPETCDGKAKAEMLLGYLAWTEKSEKVGEVQQNKVA
ncbi:MAG: hypothetical protein CV088_00125 [Nitrospira sp. LK70]|nr:hypothetical protein [Nitrospira sp. LK70]